MILWIREGDQFEPVFTCQQIAEATGIKYITIRQRIRRAKIIPDAMAGNEKFYTKKKLKKVMNSLDKLYQMCYNV